MIKRTITNTIDELILHTPVTLLTGPRQIGKTTLLTHLLKNKSFHYLSLDDVTLLMDAKADPLAFLNAHPYPLIIDEAQKAPELFAYINTLVNKVKVTKGNEKANTMYILSGSSKQSLIEQAKESLAGRMMILNMHSLSLNEIYKRKSVPFSLDKTLLSERNKIDIDETQIFDHIFRGFLPNLYSDPKVKTNIY
ncbi:MAG: AAA family ATPase [Mycoplasmoidaceae bacterium]|nr:AAA family ATPase [Mycoplasmoidaceae bacterium]